HRALFGNAVQSWLTAALTAAIALFVTLLARRLLVSRLGKLAERTTNQIDDMIVDVIRETRTWVLVVFALLLGTAHLSLPYRNLIAQGMRLVFLWQAAVWAVSAVTFWVKHCLEHRTGTHDRTRVAMI